MLFRILAERTVAAWVQRTILALFWEWKPILIQGVRLRAERALSCIPSLQLMTSPPLQYPMTRKTALLAVERMTSAAA